MTKRLVDYVLDKLREVRSYTSVAQDENLSVSTVIRLFDYIHYPSIREMPKAVGIDEFKGNTDGDKYQCILTDLDSRRVIDILPTRYTHALCTYFKQKDRSQSLFFVSDMYRNYAEMANTYFKNATYVVDKYHPHTAGYLGI